jgi:phosphoribosylformylglycinamidine synthase
MNLLVYHAGNALTPFALRKLKARLAALGCPASLEKVELVFLVLSQQSLQTDASLRLAGLLDAAPALNAIVGDDQVLVWPRAAMRSPWAARATDIAHRCGFDGVDLVERGQLFTFTFLSGTIPEPIRQVLRTR